MWIAIGCLISAVVLLAIKVGLLQGQIDRLSELAEEFTKAHGVTHDLMKDHLSNQHGMKVEEFWVSMN